ncbi:MAG: Fic family protein [Jatrophihabitans sp.]
MPALIAVRAVDLPSAVASLAEEASVEIARFDAELEAEAALFGAVLVQAESVASSRIEGISAGASAIALASLGSTANDDAQEVVGNIAAVHAAVESADDVDGILDVHYALLGDLHPDIAGRWRDEQVWIGGMSASPHDAMFVPPHHEHVPALMDDLVAFAGRTDLPLFAQVAIAHAQFETIHPFADGNGRTGRALIHAALRRRGLTSNVAVPISTGLLTETKTYFEALTAYRKGDASAIVECLANASFATTASGRQLVAALHAIRLNWDDTIKARRGASAWRAADLLLRQPIIDAATVGAELGIEPRNAQRAIAPLANAGAVTELTGSKRNRLWQATEVFAAFDRLTLRGI